MKYKTQGTARVWVLFLLAALAWLQHSCKPQDEVVTNTPGSPINVSADTIQFDTVITTLWSPTRRLRIYNPNSEAITISSIKTSAGGPFSLQMFVNGRPGPMQENVLLRGNDSLLVLLQVNLSSTAAGQPFLLRDSLTITTQGIASPKRVFLQAWGQNAIFYNGDSIKTNTIWADQERPYYIQNSILVPPNITLTIKEGVRVFNFENSNILVQGRLLVEGTRAKPVIFTGTRQEARFDLQPNQWGAIAILGNSRGSVIRHAIIKNGLRGLQVGVPGTSDVPECYITNSLIRAQSEWGIAGFGSRITATNNLIIDCGTQAIALFKGGAYAFVHNTTGYSNQLGFSRNEPSVFIANYWRVSDGVYERGDLNLFFCNNLVAGSRAGEFLFDNSQGAGAAFNLDVRGNAVRADRNTTALTDAGNNLLSSRFRFRNGFTGEFSYDSTQAPTALGRNLDSNNVARDFPEVLSDYWGKPRNTLAPDPGALNSTRTGR